MIQPLLLDQLRQPVTGDTCTCEYTSDSNALFDCVCYGIAIGKPSICDYTLMAVMCAD